MRYDKSGSYSSSVFGDDRQQVVLLLSGFSLCPLTAPGGCGLSKPNYLRAFLENDGITSRDCVCATVAHLDLFRPEQKSTDE